MNQPELSEFALELSYLLCTASPNPLVMSSAIGSPFLSKRAFVATVAVDFFLACFPNDK